MDERTLTGRVERIEQLMGLAENSGCDTAVTGRGQMSGEDYKDAQQYRNRVLSDRVAQGEEKTSLASSFEEIMNRVQNCTDRVCKTAGSLEEIGNRIFGSLPEGMGAGNEEARRQPDGTFEHALLALDWLDESLIRLQRATTRLERV